MWRCVWLLTACGRIGFDPGAPGDAGADATPIMLCGDMPSTSFDSIPNGFSEYDSGGGTTLETDGTLHITFGTDSDLVHGIETPLVAFRDRAARIRIVKPLGGGGATQIGLHGYDELGLHVEMYNDTIDINSRDLGGAQTERSVARDPAEVWWQFREAGGTVFVEVSADAVTWRSLYETTPDFFDIDDVFVDMGGYTGSGLPAPDDLRFDDFTAECPP